MPSKRKLNNQKGGNKMKFYKILNTKCDFCNKTKNVVTQVDLTYVCAKCAREINKHARINEKYARINEKYLEEKEELKGVAI